MVLLGLTLEVFHVVVEKSVDWEELTHKDQDVIEDEVEQETVIAFLDLGFKHDLEKEAEKAFHKETEGEDAYNHKELLLFVLKAVLESIFKDLFYFVI